MGKHGFRAVAAMVGFAGALAGCNATVSSGNVSGLSTDEISAVAVADGWQPNEKIHTRKPSPIAAMNFGPSRKGYTPEGYSYAIYKDGSGSVDPTPGIAASGWSIDCAKDAMTDKRKCSISSITANILVFYGYANSPRSVCIIGHDFPGRTGAIRLDQGAPVTTDAEGCIPWARAAALPNSAQVTTRKVKWPYDYPVDEVGSLAGIKQAMDLVGFIQRKGDSLSF